MKRTAFAVMGMIIMSAPAVAADEFGARFGSDAPVALQEGHDVLDADLNSILSLEPAAGDETAQGFSAETETETETEAALDADVEADAEADADLEAEADAAADLEVEADAQGAVDSDGDTQDAVEDKSVSPDETGSAAE